MDLRSQHVSRRDQNCRQRTYRTVWKGLRLTVAVETPSPKAVTAANGLHHLANKHSAIVSVYLLRILLWI